MEERIDKTAEIEEKSAGKKRVIKRRVKTMTKRVMLNYCFFAAAVLIMFWVVLLFGLFGFYETILRIDLRRMGDAAGEAFPSRVDDNSLSFFYRVRLSEIARSNSANIVIFRRDDEAEIILTVDAMGNSAMGGEGGEFFDDIIASVDIDKTLASKYPTAVLHTQGESFIYHVSKHTVVMGEEDVELYMLAIKPYSLFNYQINMFIALLGMCSVTVLGIAFVSSYFASRYQTRMLTGFTKQAKRMAGGDYNVRFSGKGLYEYDILANALNEATESVKRAEELQRDFVANVSHDIRTPLTIIRAYAEMLRDMPLDEKKRNKTAQTIIAEADRLTTLSDDILNYSRLQAGVIEFKFEPCNLSETAEAALERFSLLCERDGMKFVTEIEKGVTVCCDIKNIEQVLYNLISNACNYCGEDKTVIVRLKTHDGKARFEVTDHGKGIAEDEIDSVWDRYYRTARSKRTTVGTGLGLSICNNVLKAHGAEFGVISKLGEGSTFWFELDLLL